MSFRIASSPLLSGAFAVSPYAGLGVLGSAIPTSGDNGPSPLLNDGIVATSEYAWELVTPPSAGVLTLYPDGSFVWNAVGVADGIYSFEYRLYEDGADSGTGTVYLSFGVGLTVADMGHGHALDPVVLSLPAGGSVDLVVGDLAHAHGLDASTLATTGSTSLVVGDMNHAHGLDAQVLDAPLPGVANLVVADLLHAPSLDTVALGFQGIVDLLVDDLGHWHRVDAVIVSLPTLEVHAEILHARPRQSVLVARLRQCVLNARDLP